MVGKMGGPLPVEARGPFTVRARAEEKSAVAGPEHARVVRANGFKEVEPPAVSPDVQRFAVASPAPDRIFAGGKRLQCPVPQDPCETGLRRGWGRILPQVIFAERGGSRVSLPPRRFGQATVKQRRYFSTIEFRQANGLGLHDPQQINAVFNGTIKIPVLRNPAGIGGTLVEGHRAGTRLEPFLAGVSSGCFVSEFLAGTLP